MPTITGRAFERANYVPDLPSLKAINFGSSDPKGCWFISPNSDGTALKIWVWEPTSTATPDDVEVVLPDSVPLASPGRLMSRLKLDISTLGGILAAIAALSTDGLIKKTGTAASTVSVSTFAESLLNDADASTARSTLGLGDVATRNIGTSAGQVRSADDAAYTNARAPLSHGSTHSSAGSDPISPLDIGAQPLDADLTAIAGLSTTGAIERTGVGSVETFTVTAFGKSLVDDADATAARSTLGLGAAATRAIGTSTGQIRDAADAAYTNARTPTAHASSHVAGGSDPITGRLAITDTTESTSTTTGAQTIAGGLGVAKNIVMGGILYGNSQSTYGSISIGGTKAGLAGIHFPDAFGSPSFLFHPSLLLQGFWSTNLTANSVGGWGWWYNAGTIQIFNTGADSDGAYVYISKAQGMLPGYPTQRFPVIGTDNANLYFVVGPTATYAGYVNAGGFNNVSGGRFKTVLSVPDPEECLKSIERLPVTRYHLKGGDPEYEMIGTFAEDFYREFKLGGKLKPNKPDDPASTISTANLAGVLLLGVKGLIKTINNFSERLTKLEKTIENNNVE